MKRKELSLEIKVYSYSCKEEKEEHVIEMRQSGFNIKKEDYKHDCEYKYIVKYEKDTSNTNEYCLNLEPDFEDCGNYFTDEEKKEKLNTIITGIQDTILNEMKTEFHFVISAKIQDIYNIIIKIDNNYTKDYLEISLEHLFFNHSFDGVMYSVFENE